jgi:lantibiotic biosynthesis protein
MIMIYYLTEYSNEMPELNTDCFLDIAVKIGTELCRQAYWDGERCNWIGRNTMETSDGNVLYTNAALGPNFYEGSSGVALFLAILYNYSGKETHKLTAIAAIRQSLSHITDIPPICKFGFYTGYVGIAYVAAHLGLIFKDQNLLSHAKNLIRNLKNDFDAYHLMDVISGNAGAIPALLVLYDIFHEEAIFELASKLGEQLLSCHIEERVGWSWNSTVNGAEKTRHNLLGFSHGAAGIGYSLLELFARTNMEKFRIAAEKAFAYENYWFNQRQNNWPDFRIFTKSSVLNSDDFNYMTAWCHGAPGIALSRIRAYQILKEEKYLRDSIASLGTAMKTIKRSTKEKNNDPYVTDYSLCHGLAGIAESLLLGYEVLHKESYRKCALDVGLSGINGYGKTGLKWPCGTQTGEIPSFMLGLAGIGYFYLRLHDLELVSSILLL